MKRSLKQKFIGIALSVFSISTFAQCPSITNLSVSYGANGSATVVPTITGTTTPSQPYYYWSTASFVNQVSGQNSFPGVFNFPSNGTYTVCLSGNDSTTSCSTSLCTTVTITNMSSSVTPCQADFTAYTDSNCLTHFANLSTGNNLTYEWYDLSNGPASLISTQQNPNLNLSQGSHFIALYTNSNGLFCDSTTQLVHVFCGGASTSCNASFSFYTDSSNCTTTFYSTSTGSNLSYAWYIGGAYFTTANPSVQLSNGSTYVELYTSSNGQFCDSISSYANINCSGVPDTTINNCQANSYFSVYADSTNTGNYFAYNMSSGTGNVSYLWNFGDNTSSTQQYPFHQYAIPGHYVLCLTVTATSGSITCTDMYCDSSSVQRIASGFLMSQIAVIPQAVTGIKNESIIKGLNVFPNPMQDELIVEMTSSENLEGAVCILVDALGKVVLETSLTDPKTTINTSNLDKGFYFLTISENNNKTIKTIKLIK